MKSTARRSAIHLRGIIFDLDGTLVDSGLDFEAMRQEMGLPPGRPVLETLDRLDPHDAERCRAILNRHEIDGAMRATPLPGVVPFLTQAASLGLRRAVMTRNSRMAAALTLCRCGLEFEHILTRDDGPIKPNPWAIHQICHRWNMEPREILVIGDFHFDLEAGRAAGSTTVLVCNGKLPSSIPGHQMADVYLSSFVEAEELTRLLRNRARDP